MLNRCRLLTLTFLVTGAFDALLQLSKHGYMPIIPMIVGDSDWFISLTKSGGYFDRHTPAAAVLLAGIVGYLAQAIILSIIDFPVSISIRSVVPFLIVTFVVSALFGLLMNDAWPVSTGLFPIISATYYKDLGKKRSMVTDGLSGLVVNTTILIFLYFLK